MALKTIDDLVRATGLSREKLTEVWKQVKENHKLLDGCPGPHAFERTDEAAYKWNSYKCRKCGGRVGYTEQLWYMQGIRDAYKGKV